LVDADPLWNMLLQYSFQKIAQKRQRTLAKDKFLDSLVSSTFLPIRHLILTSFFGLQVCHVSLEALRDSLEHGQAAAARRIPVLNALRCFRIDHRFLVGKWRHRLICLKPQCEENKTWKFESESDLKISF